MFKSSAKQLGPKGIRVNGVAPGPIWTPLQVCGGANEEKLRKLGSETPLGRPGQPVELASIYVQLAANDASFANGQIYGSAGGSGPIMVHSSLGSGENFSFSPVWLKRYKGGATLFHLV
jgi:NAD(P)-dependent dehydrogenase (short-subunit alcohol dehydrogenase family)